MLKYQLGRQIFDNDTVALDYRQINFSDYNAAKIMVGVQCTDVTFINSGDVLSFTGSYTFNDSNNNPVYIGDSGSVLVYAVNYSTNTVYFTDNKTLNLDISSITAEVVNGNITWILKFNNTHYFDATEYADINITHYNGISVHLSSTTPVDYNTLMWEYDSTVENIQLLSMLIFGDIDVTIDKTVYGNVTNLFIYREQARWSLFSTASYPLTFTLNRYKVNLTIPISVKDKTDLYKESNIEEYFVQYEEEKAVNPPIEMEKYSYTPVVVSKIQNNNLTFEDCTKINFNLHFRVHDGDDWTVIDTDSWNFDKYGNNNNQSANKYYSYAQNASVDQDQWKRSCQSDLLTYLDFTTNDVKYQKNKLKKSFIRLLFYNSDDPTQQSLLGYSTIFVDCNKLYSKFISRMNFNCYFNSDGDIVKGIKVDREVNTTIAPDSLTSILNSGSLTLEDIEDSRLSAQITTKNKFISNNSSEGFYLYTWELNDDPTIPSDVYMKVEFNHAGYGRSIPMMAPYRDDPNNRGFKTNSEIVSDWTSPNTGYGIKKYTRYSYIHLKAKYDVNTKRHIYYLDPDTYGTKYNWDKSVLNINLYEARISFE